MKEKECAMGTVLEKQKGSASPPENLVCEDIYRYSERQDESGERQIDVSFDRGEAGPAHCSGVVTEAGAKLERRACGNDEELVDTYRASIEERLELLLHQPVESIHVIRWARNGKWNVDFDIREMEGDIAHLEMECSSLDVCERMKVQSDMADHLTFETPEVRWMMEDLIRRYGLQLLWSTSTVEINFDQREFIIETSAIELFRQSPERFSTLLKINAENVIDSTRNALVRVEFDPISEYPEAPLPFYRSVAFPQPMSPDLRARLDVEDDDRLSSVEEAWHAFALFHRSGALTEDERRQLKPVIDQLTKVDPKNGRISVNGHLFEIALPAELGEEAVILQGGPNAFAKRLFAIGEAMRSFGPHMVRRWAQGEGDERGLTFIGIDPETERPPTLASDDIASLMESLFGYPCKAAAVYNPFANRFGTGVLPTLELQYKVARHELGHSIDDFLVHGDRNSLTSFRIGLLSEMCQNPIKGAFWRFTLNGERAHRMNACVEGSLQWVRYPLWTDFSDVGETPIEWFAQLFEKPGLWSYAGPELRGVVKCFLEGGSAEACTGVKPPSDIE